MHGHKSLQILFLESLLVAQHKANKAKYTSDLSSQNDERRKQGHSKRKNKKNKSTNHLSDKDSSDLSRFESDTSYPSTSPLTTNGKHLFSLEIIFLGFYII